MVGLKRGVVKLIEYHDAWKFEAEQTVTELRGLLGDTAIDIQHIGSTAIPSIHAKPIIDIAVGVHDLNDITPYVEVLRDSHYIFRGEDVPGQILFVKGNFEKNTRSHHIHAVKWNGVEWENYINFRDFLNAVPKKAQEYDIYKQKLAEQYYNDRKHYTEGKQRIITELLEEAKMWREKYI